MSADKQKGNAARWSLMLWKHWSVHSTIPLTFADLFSMFAYCHSKEPLQYHLECLYTDPESQYLRKACFLSTSFLIVCYQKRLQRGPNYTEHRQYTRYSEEIESKKNLQQSHTTGLPWGKTSMRGQCLHVVTAGCCDTKTLQICGYLGGSSPSLPAVLALQDPRNKAIVK